MKLKRTVALLTTSALMLSALCTSAFATNVAAAGDATTPVTVKAEATTFNVTVPAGIPLAIKADGSVVTPSDIKITNNSGGPVKVTKIAMQHGAWNLTDYNGGNRSKLAAEGVDTKKLGLSLTANTNQVVTSKDGDQEPTMDSTKWVINGKDSETHELPIAVGAIASAVSTAISTEVTAANVVFTIGWNT